MSRRCLRFLPIAIAFCSISASLSVARDFFLISTKHRIAGLTSQATSKSYGARQPAELD
jgi:hypothetical protein